MPRDPKLSLWVFRRGGGLVGVSAASENAAARLLGDGQASHVVLYASEGLAAVEPGDALAALGSVDQDTTLLDDYAPHDHSLFTVHDERGRRWALRASMRLLAPPR